MSRQPTRRDFIAGLVASLALCFAPLDRFIEGLQRMLAAVYGAPTINGKMHSYSSIEVTIGGNTMCLGDTVTFSSTMQDITDMYRVTTIPGPGRVRLDRVPA